jgi:hypothetical protein
MTGCTRQTPAQQLSEAQIRQSLLASLHGGAQYVLQGRRRHLVVEEKNALGYGAVERMRSRARKRQAAGGAPGLLRFAAAQFTALAHVLRRGNFLS